MAKKKRRRPALRRKRRRTLERRPRGKRRRRTRRNPWSERQAWREVQRVARTLPGADARNLVRLATTMLGQLDHNIHENPLLGVLNPPRGGRLMATRVYDVRYRHAEGKRLDYRHPFAAGTRMYAVGGRNGLYPAIVIRRADGKPVAKDFSNVRE